jgi:VIT1/CCC1 family predicted Fe2+/Mn2+ transporter
MDNRPPSNAPAHQYSPVWLRQHLAEERRLSSRLGDVREIVFGAQDGLVSTLAVVATVAGASADTFAVVVAGNATALAGVCLISSRLSSTDAGQFELDTIDSL